MTRRDFLAAAAAGARKAPAPVTVPVHHVIDRKADWSTKDIGHFWSHMWPQAAGELAAGGVRLECSLGTGEVLRPPGREPVITGLESGTLNFVLTDRIPMEWDGGRSLCGVTMRYRGYHMCMAAVDRAHCNQIPLLSINTCLHELLHALMLDIFVSRPAGWYGSEREWRIDWYATRLWLFHDGAEIQKSARTYVERLRAEAQARSMRYQIFQEPRSSGSMGPPPGA